MQAELDKEFTGKEVIITPENDKWEIKVDNVIEYVKSGKKPTPTVKNTLQVGDYVKYSGAGSCSVFLGDIGVQTSYASNTGYTWDNEGNVTFLPENVVWRVWEKKQDGTVTIVPERPVNRLWLSGKNGFVNYIEILERICDIYANESLNVKNDDVRSLKLEDIANDRVSNLKRVIDEKLSEFENNYGTYYENNPYKNGTFYMEADGLTLNKNGYQASDSNPVRIKNTGGFYDSFQFKNIRK